MHLQEIEWECVDWIELTRGKSCEHTNEPTSSIKFREFYSS